MTCSELNTLRAQASETRKKLQDIRQKARTLAAKEQQHGGRLHLRSDWEILLERKLASLAQDIERHIGRHGCS